MMHFVDYFVHFVDTLSSFGRLLKSTSKSKMLQLLMKTKGFQTDLSLWSLFLTLFLNFNLAAQCPTPPGNPAIYGSGS